jgi:hypothetical protein
VQSGFDTLSFASLEGVEKSTPKTRFSGRNNEINFERFMASMERSMDAEGVTDELRVEHIDNWFSGQALRIVQSKKNNDVFVDAVTTLDNIKRVLKKKYVEEFDAERMLKILARGKPIARCNLEDVRALIVDLECQFDLARGKGEAAIFERKSIYRDILSARLPHLITKWNEEFGGGRKKWTFEAFTEFIEEATKVEEEGLLYRKVESRTEETTSYRSRNKTMGPFASGYPDASANDKRMQGQRRPRSDDRKSEGCKICSEEHQVADCKKFLAMNLDERVETCKSQFMCFKCLDDTSHNFVSCRCSTKCNTCSSVTHHTLLHGIKRFHPLPSQASTQKNNPL